MNSRDKPGPSDSQGDRSNDSPGDQSAAKKPDRSRDPRSLAREYALQFLYLSEIEQLFHFSESHFHSFVSHQEIKPKIAGLLQHLVAGTLNDLPDLDQQIEAVASHWSVNRMPIIDRCILRIATFELSEAATPPRVAVNEAIELAKKFGSAESHKFVNGVLDRMLKNPRIEHQR